MLISLNKAHYPVTVLGPGKRLGIWLQGCSIGCKNCVSQDTWPQDKGRDMSVAQLLEWCKHTAAADFAGVTISGGEPFDQAKALDVFIDGLKGWRRVARLDFDILCYSGYPFKTLQQKYPLLLNKLDALIPEPYVDHHPLTHVWRGSSNQPLITLSPRGVRKYSAYLNMTHTAEHKRIQTQLDGQRIWYVGIPDRGDMVALEQACQSKGLTLSEVSWRS